RSADLAPLLQRAHGRPDPGAVRGAGRGQRHPRAADGRRGALRGVVRAAGRRLSLTPFSPRASRMQPIRNIPTVLATALALCLSACDGSAPAPAATAPAAPTAAQVVDSEQGQARPSVVASGLAHPWPVPPLPEGGFLVTERGGALRRISADGSISGPLAGVPEVTARGQGGLLDVALA